MANALGFVATLIFGFFWALVCWVVVTDPPPELPQERMVLIYVVLATGVLAIFRSLALGF